jgi:hypothetical protein
MHSGNFLGILLPAAVDEIGVARDDLLDAFVCAVKEIERLKKEKEKLAVSQPALDDIDAQRLREISM